jgi:hypothetical protein
LQAAVTDSEIPVCHLLCQPVAWFEKLQMFDMNLAEMNEQCANIPKRNTSNYFQANIDANTKELLQLENIFTLPDLLRPDLYTIT